LGDGFLETAAESMGSRATAYTKSFNGFAQTAAPAHLVAVHGAAQHGIGPPQRFCCCNFFLVFLGHGLSPFFVIVHEPLVGTVFQETCQRAGLRESITNLLKMKLFICKFGN